MVCNFYIIMVYLNHVWTYHIDGFGESSIRPVVHEFHNKYSAVIANTQSIFIMRDMASIIYINCVAINLNLITDCKVNTHSFGWHGTFGMTKRNIFKSTSTISFLQPTSHRTTFALNNQTKYIQTSHLMYNASNKDYGTTSYFTKFCCIPLIQLIFLLGQ